MAGHREMTGDTRRFVRGGALVVGLIVAAAPALASTPLSYATQVDDGQGDRRDLSFQGSASRGVVSGTLRVNNVDLGVSGIIATDGSVSGTVRRPNGTQAATFSARPNARGMLEGSVTYGGATRPWVAPIILPSATAP